MENHIANFKLKEVLNFNQTQKTLFLLGSIQDQQGQAIAILSPKLHDPNNLAFQQIITAFVNDIYARFTVTLNSQFNVQFIFPITEKHKKKYLRKKLQIKKQTGQQYLAKKQQLLKTELTHIKWVINILQGKTQVDRVLHKSPQFMICQDFKWADIKDINNMHITVLFQDPSLHSLRQLRGQHVELLQNVGATVQQVLQQQLGIDTSDCRMYFHYPPTFYRLHVHVMSLSLESLSCRVERCHDFGLVVQNLKMNTNYYQEITLNTFIEK